MGLGNSAFRRVPADREFPLDLGALRTLIESDRRKKMQPFCVVANAGTIGTGAIDDWRAIRPARILPRRRPGREIKLIRR
jgi:aromatic-L-amino-acid decarboxylase